MAAGDEKTYFDEGGVLVTQSRFVVQGDTYAMRNVTAVKMKRIEASKGMPIAMIVIGLFAILSLTTWGVVVGLVVGGLGLGILMDAKDAHVVMLSTSGSDLEAIKSPNKGRIQRVVAALNQAIIDRG